MNNEYKSYSFHEDEFFYNRLPLTDRMEALFWENPDLAKLRV